MKCQTSYIVFDVNHRKRKLIRFFVLSLRLTTRENLFCRNGKSCKFLYVNENRHLAIYFRQHLISSLTQCVKGFFGAKDSCRRFIDFLFVFFVVRSEKTQSRLELRRNKKIFS